MFVFEIKNVMLLDARDIKGGEFRIYTFLEVDKYEKITVLGSSELVSVESKTMVDIKLSLRQQRAENREVNKLFVIDLKRR